MIRTYYWVLWVTRFNVMSHFISTVETSYWLISLNQAALKVLRILTCFIITNITNMLCLYDEQYSSEVNHKDIHPKLLFNLQKQNLCSCVYQKQLPKSTGETTSYLHENTLTNTVWANRNIRYLKGLRYINWRERKQQKFVKNCRMLLKGLLHIWLTYQNWIALMIPNQKMEKLCHITDRHCVRCLLMKTEKWLFE